MDLFGSARQVRTGRGMGFKLRLKEADVRRGEGREQAVADGGLSGDSHGVVPQPAKPTPKSRPPKIGCSVGRPQFRADLASHTLPNPDLREAKRPRMPAPSAS